MTAGLPQVRALPGPAPKGAALWNPAKGAAFRIRQRGTAPLETHPVPKGAFFAVQEKWAGGGFVYILYIGKGPGRMPRPSGYAFGDYRLPVV